MAKLRTFIAILRVAFADRSEVHAEQTANHFRTVLEEHSLEDNDTCDVVQCVDIGVPVKEEDTILRLKLARNDLTRMPYKDCMDIAQLLDKVIFKLEQQVTEDDALPNNYDHNRIIRVAHDVRVGLSPMF